MQALALALEQGREQAAAACFEQLSAALADLEDEFDRAPRGRLREPVSLAEVAEQAAHRWGAGLDVEVSAAAADCRLLADRSGVARAVDNLIANSLEHGSGPVRLKAAVVDGAASLAVADGGPRPDPADRRRGPGRGHGLAVVREVARAHRGELREPEPTGSGTVAQLRIPIARSPRAQR
jgi:two-component system, sensor histidine kinase FlrB